MPKIILAAHGRITTRFREDIGRGFPHNGVDQGHNNATDYDLEIMAPADGVIVSAGKQGSYGLRYIIRHDDDWTSILAHHAEQFKKPGDRIEQGEIIAVMGNTGTVYVHSHQELLNEKNQQIDPLLHLGSTAATISKPLPAAEPTPELGDTDMRYIWTKNRPPATVGPTGYHEIKDMETANVAMALYGYVALSDRQYDVARQDAINRGNDFAALVARLK
jgi:murein DD-endopeptidase MepM/ murein hydrolase activator NlpD